MSKISKSIYPTISFTEIKTVDMDCFNYLHKIENDGNINFFIRLESFSPEEINKVKYYFDQICEVNENLLKITNKKRRNVKIFDIIRNNREVVGFEEIIDNQINKTSEMDLGKTFKPYMDAQEEEVVLYPSDEE